MNGRSTMSDDEELEKIFDEDHNHHQQNGEATMERQTDENSFNLLSQEQPQRPSSSRCIEIDDGVYDDDEDEQEEILTVDDEIFPSEPIGTATLPTASSLKKRPPLLPSPDGVVKKRVRIAADVDDIVEVVKAESNFIDQFVAMGYDRAKVAAMYISIGGNPDDNHIMNLMIDKLSQQEDEQAEQEQAATSRQTNSPFAEPIQCSSSNFTEHLESMNDYIRPSPQKPSPSFVDLCEEHVLRKYLIMKYPPCEDSCTFVVRTATLMAQRLSQINHISKVARLSEIIFNGSESLYHHYKLRQPSEPASDIIDRRGIVKENETPFGVLIDVAEAFVNNDGLQHISDRIKDPAMSIRDIGHLCSILSDIVWMCFPRSLDGTMAEAAERMRAMMKEYSEKEIRDERTRREIFEAARKVCKGMTAGITVSPRYEFIERLMLCGNMEAKKNAIDELTIICDHEMTESCNVRRWMKSRNILPILLSDHLDHIEYAVKIGPILRKLAPVMSEREFRSVWCLQKGRGGISPEIFSTIIAFTAIGLQEDQIVMLFKYIKRQLKRMRNCPLQQHTFARSTDMMMQMLGSRNVRPPIALKDKQLYVECYVRMFDKFLPSHPAITVLYNPMTYGMRVADMLRGQPPVVAGFALSRLAREVNRMKDGDARFPFYYNLMNNICIHIKLDMPSEYKSIGPILGQNNFAEKSTRMIIANARQTLLDVDRLDQLCRHNEEMLKMRHAFLLKKQQEAAAAAASASDTDATASRRRASSAASSLQPSPAISAAAAAAQAPPPSAVTPISNGPSPKRDGSPAGSSTQVSPELTASSSNATVAPTPSAGNIETEKKEETVSVCTPPCTPEPLRVNVARLGTKEWDREALESAVRMNALANELSMRLIQYSSMATIWNEHMCGDEPLPSCSMLALPQSLQEDMFSLLVESTRNGLHKRIIQVLNLHSNPFWQLLPNLHSMHTIIRTMLRQLEHKPPVFRALITRLCAMPADLVNAMYVDIVRTTADTCFSSALYNKSTDWLEEMLRFLWRLATCKLSDVRERAIDVLKAILCERYRSLRPLEIFTIARLNEANENLTRVHGLAPLPRWVVPKEEDEEEEDCDEEMNQEIKEEVKEEDEVEMREVKEEEMSEVKKEDEEGKENAMEGESGEQAVDLRLEPRDRTHTACRDTVEALLRRMKIEIESKCKEDAEFHLSRTISFVKRMIGYGYLQTKCPSSLTIRERAIPGEMAELTLRVQSTTNTLNYLVFVSSNESVNVFGERLKKLVPHSSVRDTNFPRGYKIRHCNATLDWERGWDSVTHQMNLGTRGPDGCQQIDPLSPFNEDIVSEITARRDHGLVDTRLRLDERSLGYVAADSKLASILIGCLGSFRASSHLQEAVINCLQLLPLQPIDDEEALMEVCTGALSLQKPHEALHHLISLLAALIPPRLTREEASAAKQTFQFLRQTSFVPRFMTMIREVDDISSVLSIEALSLFHEVCLTLIRLFYLHDSGKHRAYKHNRATSERLAQESAPVDTSAIADSLQDDELPPLLRTLMHFTWTIVAPRRLDVEKEMNVIVTSPSVRLQYAKEKKVENPFNHRRSTLAKGALKTILDIASKYGSWERNVNTILSPSSIDGSTTAFWRDMLMNVGSIEIQHEAHNRLCSLINNDRRAEEERAVARRVLVRLVFELGRPVWGPSAALVYCSTGRNAVDLLKLAEKVVKATRRDEFGEGLLEEWIDLEIGFISEDRPMWNARCHMSLHVQLLQELLKKQERDTMLKVLRRCLQPLFTQALFPFAANIKAMEERCGSYPVVRAIGHGLAEGDVRRKYMETIIFYCQEFPDFILGILDYLSNMIHGPTLLLRAPIMHWEKAERSRRQRAESFCGPQLTLAQRLHSLAHAQREAEVRMVKGLLNPSYMCYANSVLQQLVFMPGVCEALFAIGDVEHEFGDMTEEEDIKNGGLLRSVQQLFAYMLFSAEQSMSADTVLANIDLPSGGSVREQQDCVEFFLTLIDKCDMAAEKFNRPPVFKRFLEGVMGYEYACKTCKHRHRGADESFTALNLEIHGTTVGDSLDHFMDGALLEGASAAMCEQCGEKRTTLRIGALRSAPSTLCIQLKRFSTYEANGGKLNSKVDVPRELDLTRFSEAVRTATDDQVDRMFGWFDDTQDEPVVFTPPPDCPVHWKYRLVGVIVHSGQLGNGHYTSYVRERRPMMRGRPWFDQWLLANDDRVSVQEERVAMEWQGSGEENTPSAYLLWYEMIEDEPPVVTVAAPEEDTVAPEEEEDTVATVLMETTVEALPSSPPPPLNGTLEQQQQLAERQRERAECDWMDIGLGSLGVLEGSLLELWKCVPDHLTQAIVLDNIRNQLGRDVLTESYAKFLYQMLEMAKKHAATKAPDEKLKAQKRILGIAHAYMTQCLWQTREPFAVDADSMIGQYRLSIGQLLNEHTELCKEWLRSFYDPQLQAISEEARDFTTSAQSIKPAVSAWWWLAQHAVSALRGDAPDLVEAYCNHMVECLRVSTLRMDGFAMFFIQTVGSPHCLEFHLRRNILAQLVNIMFYFNKKTQTCGLHGDFTARQAIPINVGLFQLFHDAIERDLINEYEVRKFVERYLHLAMGPMTRHGEDHLMKMVHLLNTALRVYGERDASWTHAIAQAILNCLKIDPHRANGLFYVVTTVGKSLNAERGRDFYDELLGKCEQAAAENGLIYPGIVHMLEDMLAARKESRGIQQIEIVLTRTIESSPGFRERADAYASRLDAIRIRLAEWKEQEALHRSVVEAQLSVTRSMLMGADAFGMLPLDACGPIARPAGGSNGRECDMMQVSDDDIDDDDDEMMSDEEEFSESEGPVNLSNNRR